MKRLIGYSVIVLAIAPMLLCGCATYGNKTVDDPAKYLNVKAGKSTKPDIYGVFGQPHDVQYANDRSDSVWIYFKVESSLTGWSYVPYVGVLAGGTNEDTTKAYFFFDANGRLTRDQMNKKSDSENNWVAMGRMASQGDRDDRAARVSAEMAEIGKPFDKKLAHRVKFVR